MCYTKTTIHNFGETAGGHDSIFPGIAGPGTSITNQGGALIIRVPVQLIFWGTAWLQSSTTPSANQIISAVQTILSGPYMSALRQYGVWRGHFAGSLIVTSPNAPTGTFSEQQVKDLVWALIDDGHYPEPDDTDGRNLYCVILPVGVTSSSSPANVGNHSYATSPDFLDYEKAWYAWIENDGALGNFNSAPRIFSHELVEACVDPEGDAWQINPVNSSNWNEIGDVCNSAAATALLNGVLVQSYWSQADNACIIPTAYSVRRILKWSGHTLGGKGLRSIQTPITSLNALIVSL
jgi:hypothetical protein